MERLLQPSALKLRDGIVGGASAMGGRAQLSARAQSRSPAVEQMRVVTGSGRLAYVVGGRLRG